MDKFSPEVRSRIMSKIRKKNTKAEIILRKALWNSGKRGYRIHYSIPGCPDIVYPSIKLAIFVDGDFWHGYLWKKLGKVPPKIYWQDKINNNIRRDRKIDNELKKLGWNVIRIWEHTVLQDTNKAVEIVSRKIRSID